MCLQGKYPTGHAKAQNGLVLLRNAWGASKKR